MNQNCLLITMIGCKGLPGIFISNRKKGQDSGVAERVCVRGRVLWVVEDNVGNKNRLLENKHVM